MMLDRSLRIEANLGMQKGLTKKKSAEILYGWLARNIGWNCD